MFDRDGGVINEMFDRGYIWLHLSGQ